MPLASAVGVPIAGSESQVAPPHQVERLAFGSSTVPRYASDRLLIQLQVVCVSDDARSREESILFNSVAAARHNERNVRE